MDRELVGVRVIDRDKLRSGLHQSRHERHIPRQPIKLCDDQGSLSESASREGFPELSPIGIFAALDFDEIVNELPADAVDMA